MRKAERPITGDASLLRQRFAHLRVGCAVVIKATDVTPFIGQQQSAGPVTSIPCSESSTFNDIEDASYEAHSWKGEFFTSSILPQRVPSTSGSELLRPRTCRLRAMHGAKPKRCAAGWKREHNK